MYLLHFFFVFALANFVNEHIADLSNFYVACVWALAGLLSMLPLVTWLPVCRGAIPAPAQALPAS